MKILQHKWAKMVQIDAIDEKHEQNVTFGLDGSEAPTVPSFILEGTKRK
jgi:hypothetical protein